MAYKLTWTHEDLQFSLQMVLVLLWILNPVLRKFVLCLWSDKSEFEALLWFLIGGLVQVLFLSLVVNFSTAIFLLLPLE